MNRIAQVLGVSRNVIDLRLRELGLPIRGRSEAERIKWQAMTAEQRRAQTRAAHDAVRGSVVPLERRIAAARSRQDRARSTESEATLAGMLAERGIRTVAQQQV